MDPANVPLPDTPNASEASTADVIGSPSATATVLAASSIVLQRYQNSLLAQLYRLPNTIVDVFVPLPVRQGWGLFFMAARNKISTHSASYRYGVPTLVFFIALTEYQQPGFFPRPESLSNAIIGFLCATALVLGTIALQECVETKKWPWEEEGWVWPWEAWLWTETVYDLGASTRTDVYGLTLRAGPATPSATGTPSRGPAFNPPASVIRHGTPIKRTASTISMYSPAALKQPIIIPPTPQLPPGMHPIHLPPPTPTQIHKSGLMGESPRPPTFIHFSDNAFHDRAQKLREVIEWSKPGLTPPTSLSTGLSQKPIEIAADTVGSVEVDGGDDGVNKTHKQRRPRLKNLLFNMTANDAEQAND